MNKVVLVANLNKLDKHGKVCSEKKYGPENVSDQKHDFHITNWNQVDINDLIKIREVSSKNQISGYF